jgi:S1-C subfamily serine protease
VNVLGTACLLLVLALAACGSAESDEPITVENPGGVPLSLRELPRETLQSIGLACGLAVIAAGGAAERAGLRVGDVVYGVNQTKFRSARELGRMLGQPHDRPLTLLVRRGKTDFYVDLKSAGRSNATDTPLRT